MAIAEEDPLLALRRAALPPELVAQVSNLSNFTDKTGSIPDPIQMVLDERFLSRPNLYPRQATLLKIIFLRDDLFTDYDRAVIDSWTTEFIVPPDADKPRADDDPLRYIPAGPDHGLAPDIYERITMLKAQGRKWFKEVLPVIGRRGGKGYIGGLCGAIVLWHYLCRGDPQAHYGVDRDKALGMYVFSGKRDQAKVNQWRDIVNVILGAPCYERYISRSYGEVLSVFAPTDEIKKRDFAARGMRTEMDLATFQIVPKESTLTAGRGPALFALYFDEMAHVSTSSGASSSAEDVYGASTPALDQFGEDAFIYCGSSPWQMMGQFYVLCQQALEIEPDGEGGYRPVYPDKLLIQLCSWDPYEDWERAHEIPLVPESYARDLAEGRIPGREADDFYLNPDGSVRTFRRIKRPIQVYDDEMEKLERANPDTFAVERRCLDPDTRVLMADITWKRIRDVVPGDEVIAVDEEPLVPGKQRKMRTATVMNKWSTVDRAYRITFEDGTSIVCSSKHRWLSGSGSTPRSYRWRHLMADPGDPGPRQIIKPGDTIRFIVDPWEPDESWMAGYLAGVYDGEGTAACRPRSEWRVDFTQNPGEVLDATLAYLKEKGFDPVHVPNDDRVAQSYRIYGFGSMLRFIGQLGPHKLLRQAVPRAWEGRGLPKSNGSGFKVISSIEELPEQELIDIETTTKTFIAEGFVSHNSQWQAAQNSYLNPRQVDEFFAPFVIYPPVDNLDPFMVEALDRGLEMEPRILTMQSQGILSQMYVAHGDPSTSGANFAWGIAHAEGPDRDGLYHVVFDQLHVWRPSDFADGRIDYLVVQEDILRRVDAFMPELVTFDQFNSASLMAHIRKHVRAQDYPKRVTVTERTATAPMNWAMAETFKTALNMRLVHCPPHELASLELKFLQVQGRKVDHPSEGPVQTSDLADVVFNITYSLIGSQMQAFISEALSSLELQAGTIPTTSEPSFGGTMNDNEVMSALSNFGRGRHTGYSRPLPTSMPVRSPMTGRRPPRR